MTIERKPFKYKLPEQTPLTETERKENEMRLAFSKKAEEILGQEGRFIFVREYHGTFWPVDEANEIELAEGETRGYHVTRSGTW